MNNKEFKQLKRFLASQAEERLAREEAYKANAKRIECYINSPKHLAWVRELKAMNAWRSWL